MTKEDAANNIGRRVVYTPFKGCSADALEFGSITSIAPISGDARVHYDGDNLTCQY